ncbi:MAG: hypothetical protein IT442_02485 [Phycisphaeraceae bacterium]|nr:hypothetical protein [Phycisphaeraceae bacterium]
MKWGLIVLLVLWPAILYGFALLLVAVRTKYFPRRCPACRRRGLVLVNYTKVMLDDGGGKFHCEQWLFYRCSHCSEAFKQVRKNLKPLPPEEHHWLNMKQ